MACGCKFISAQSSMRDLIDLRRFQAEHATQPLALCTLVGKEGSAYRALGAKKIVAKSENSCGLLSGGCLEADIDKTVRDHWGELPFIRAFSTMNPEDKLFGYQSGCAGIIRVLCETLPSDSGEVDLFIPFGTEQKFAGVVISLEGSTLGHRVMVEKEIPSTEKSFFDAWQMPIQLAVVGCGLDAVPFAVLGEQLGWSVHFFDYRDSLRHNLPVNAQVRVMPIEDIAAALPTGRKCAVLLMTHNYSADLKILSELSIRAEGSSGYIGCLGPRRRFEQMRDELGAALLEPLANIVHAPPGLFKGTHAPESIAFSIVAEIAAKLVAS